MEKGQASAGGGQVVAQETALPVQEIRITVNATPVVLKGKKEYRVVDILDFYDFDVKTAHGSRVVVKVNGSVSNFTTGVARGDFVELYWEE